MNYDDDYLGVNNSMHPANQIEVDAEIVETVKNLTEAYESGHELDFILIKKELQTEAKDILYILETSESGLVGKVRNLILKLQ